MALARPTISRASAVCSFISVWADVVTLNKSQLLPISCADSTRRFSALNNSPRHGMADSCHILGLQTKSPTLTLPLSSKSLHLPATPSSRRGSPQPIPGQSRSLSLRVNCNRSPQQTTPAPVLLSSPSKAPAFKMVREFRVSVARYYTNQSVSSVKSPRVAQFGSMAVSPCHTISESAKPLDLCL
jgi:hypothetical protein